MNTQENLFIRWDTSELYEAQVKHLVEGDAKNKDDAWEQVAQDSFFIDYEWTHLVETLTEKINNLNPAGYWHCEVENFGWRSLSGTKEFEADDGQTFLSSLLPDTECTFNVFIDDKQTVPVIKIQNFHHDSPMGNEWYTIVAMDADAIAA